MIVRTTCASVTFAAPFFLGALARWQPAGTYDVATDEAAIDINGHTVYRRIAALIRLPNGVGWRICSIDLGGLNAAGHATDDVGSLKRRDRPGIRTGIADADPGQRMRELAASSSPGAT